MSERRELWYVSQPARLGGAGKEAYREQILQELIASGHDVVHPFNAFPYHHFEGNEVIGRVNAMQYCCDLVDMCQGRIIVTGLSEGVLLEVGHALENYEDPRLKVFPNYDPEWHARLRQFQQEGRHTQALGAIGLYLGTTE